MQTFLPFASFKLSAVCLDQQRLGKQRVEGLQILHNLLGKKVVPDPKKGPTIVEVEIQRGWNNHPIVLMWENNINALAIYTLVMCEEWMERGFKDTVKLQIQLLIPSIRSDWKVSMPQWLGDAAFHASHRSNLIRKDPAYYREGLGWTEPDNLPYVWPKG